MLLSVVAKTYDVILPYYVLNSFIAFPFFYMGYKLKPILMRVLVIWRCGIHEQEITLTTNK